jgi:hypothetical protein
MPNNFDFSNVENITEIDIEPQGWINPLTIEYGILTDNNNVNRTLSYCWRIKGTKHTFIIPIIRMDYLSSGDYKKHFEHALENFREDYLSWKENGFNTEWSKEYRDQYSRFIVV